MGESKGEALFAMHCKAYGLKPVPEYQFHPKRKWRFDFFFPHKKLAVEIEGGHWSGGRHSRGSGFEADCEKYNAAAVMGIRVLRYTTKMVETADAIEEVWEALA